MTALLNDEIVSCEPNGKVKKEGLMVGDNVKLEYNDYSHKYIVMEVYPRQNKMDRPPIANLDQLFIIISKSPKTDFLLVDKLLLYCVRKNIIPFLIINKMDLYTDFELMEIKEQYNDVVADIIISNAKEKIGVDIIKQYLVDKTSVFTGQSAVGKSTIINAIDPSLKLKTNVLSKKIERGQHTTRHSEIYRLDNNILIADTPGFSMLDLVLDIEPEELSKFCLDFAEHLDCKYTNCNHININDKDCMVAKAVINGDINLRRYERYIQLYKTQKEKWRKKYD